MDDLTGISLALYMPNETESETIVPDTPESTYGKLKKVSELIPVLSIFVLINGFIGLSAYYTVFNINVAEYLSVSDILPLFFPSFKTFFPSLAVIFLYFLSRTLLRTTKNIIRGSLLASVALIVVEFILDWRAGTLATVPLLFPVLMLVFFSQPYYRRLLAAYPVFAVIAVAMVVATANVVSARIRLNFPDKIVSFTYNDSLTIRSTSDSVYVGQTNTALFMVVRKTTKQTLVFKRDKIDKFMIRGTAIH